MNRLRTPEALMLSAGLVLGLGSAACGAPPAESSSENSATSVERQTPQAGMSPVERVLYDYETSDTTKDGTTCLTYTAYDLGAANSNNNSVTPPAVAFVASEDRLYIYPVADSNPLVFTGFKDLTHRVVPATDQSKNILAALPDCEPNEPYPAK